MKLPHNLESTHSYKTCIHTKSPSKLFSVFMQNPGQSGNSGVLTNHKGNRIGIKETSLGSCNFFALKKLQEWVSLSFSCK